MATKRGRLSRGFDTALGLFSPGRAAAAQHLRLMESDYDYRAGWLAIQHARGYASAGKSGSGTPWSGGRGSADSESLADLPVLRSRARELNRDDALGSGLTETFTTNVIGTGMVGQARTGDPIKNRNIEAVWRERAPELFPIDGLSFGEAQAQLFRKEFEDGDVGCKTLRLYGQPVAFEIIEADRITTPRDKITQAAIRDGVERDGAGRPRAYWVAKGHPGDIQNAGFIGDSADFVRVKSGQMRLLKETKRPGQTRGIPFCASILQDIRDLDALMIACLKRVQIAACLAAFIRSPSSTPGFFGSQAKSVGGGYQLEQQIVPGMMFKLYGDEEIQTVVPNFPSPELEPFVILLCRRIGAALGICWQTVLHDFSQSTYSSSRTDQLGDRKTFEKHQSRFIDTLNWAWFITMQDAQLRDDPRLRGTTVDDFRLVNWIANGWKWVDPIKEAKAAELELAMGKTSLQRICAESGADMEEVMRERLEAEKLEKELRKEFELEAPETEDENEKGGSDA